MWQVIGGFFSGVVEAIVVVLLGGAVEAGWAFVAIWFFSAERRLCAWESGMRELVGRWWFEYRRFHKVREALCCVVGAQSGVT
jgi:hypothetical protein